MESTYLLNLLYLMYLFSTANQGINNFSKRQEIILKKYVILAVNA